MIIAVTGHRNNRLKGQEGLIGAWAAQQIKALNPDKIYNGMAKGVDQIFVVAAKTLNIPIVCCYPFPKNNFSFTEKWGMENNEVVVVNDKYSKEGYFNRDKYMVDHADVVLCVWDGKPFGGTYLTREYAIKSGKQVIDYLGLRG